MRAGGQKTPKTVEDDCCMPKMRAVVRICAILVADGLCVTKTRPGDLKRAITTDNRF